MDSGWQAVDRDHGRLLSRFVLLDAFLSDEISIAMKSWSLFVAAVVALPAVLTASDAKPATADSPKQPSASTADANVTEKKEKIDFYRDRLREHRLFVEGHSDKPCEFVEAPLMRFDNPISKVGDGLIFLWTDAGRPVAAMKSYYNMTPNTWGRTFVSLATRPMELRVANQPLWTPRAAGVSFQVLKDVPAPADKPALRLIQMRDIAKQFQVVDNWGIKDPTDWQLRVLPTPLYRYQVRDEGVADGALFAYTLSGPEALLLLEARQTKRGLEWHFAASRCTRFGVTFSWKDTKVAEFPRLDDWPATQTYFHIAVPMTNYPFGDPFANDKPTSDNAKSSSK